MNPDDAPIPQPADSPAHADEAEENAKAPWRTYRSRHRQDQDDVAHAETFEPPPVIEHALVPASPPELITDPADFAKLILDLRAAGRFAFDTEFIGENTYYPRLCLIQAGTQAGVWLIDPFAVGDLAAWWELLADAAVEKIVHAGEQDLEPVQRLIGKPPANIFDTQIVGGFAGLDYPLSLVRVVEALLGTQLDAGAKFSRWDRRPLSDKQRHYAASDVRYLPAIRSDMGSRIGELGNTQLAHDACEELCTPGRYLNDPLTRKVKAKGVHKLNPKRRAVLNGLLLWREEVAESLDLPARSMLPDEGLMSLATELPRNPKDLQRAKFLPRPVREQMGEAMLDCIAASRISDIVASWGSNRVENTGPPYCAAAGASINCRQPKGYLHDRPHLAHRPGCAGRPDDHRFRLGRRHSHRRARKNIEYRQSFACVCGL